MGFGLQASGFRRDRPIENGRPRAIEERIPESASWCSGSEIPRPVQNVEAWPIHIHLMLAEFTVMVVVGRLVADEVVEAVFVHDPIEGRRQIVPVACHEPASFSGQRAEGVDRAPSAARRRHPGHADRIDAHVGALGIADRIGEPQPTIGADRASSAIAQEKDRFVTAARAREPCRRVRQRLQKDLCLKQPFGGVGATSTTS